MDKRKALLKHYLETIFHTDFIITEISNDASFRRYFRIKICNTSYIAMDAPPAQEKLDNFIFMANFLYNNKIKAPRIYYQNKILGFLILQDFGDITLLNNNNLALYKLAIDELIKIQQLTHKNLPSYSSKILLQEMNLCQEWFDTKFDYQHIFAFLLKNIITHKQVIVHRDYHSRNIMIDANKLGIIDFQDAIIGSYVYDIASLLKDAYIDLGNIDLLQKYYFQQSRIADHGIKYQKFIFDFDMIATQRHIKILGIFKRLSCRDGKNNYLNDLPQIKKYLIRISNKYPELSTLQTLCKQ